MIKAGGISTGETDGADPCTINGSGAGKVLLEADEETVSVSVVSDVVEQSDGVPLKT
jgi:hypothetical protein